MEAVAVVVRLGTLLVLVKIDTLVAFTEYGFRACGPCGFHGRALHELDAASLCLGVDAATVHSAGVARA